MARPAPQPRSSPLDTGLRLALRYPLPAPRLRCRFPRPGEGTTQVPGVRGGTAAGGLLWWGVKCPPLKWTVQRQAGGSASPTSASSGCPQTVPICRPTHHRSTCAREHLASIRSDSDAKSTELGAIP